MDFQNIMKQAQQLQQNLKTVQEDLEKREVTGTAGAGMVSAVFNGRFELVDLRIDAELARPENVGMLTDLLKAAINDGLRKTKETAKSEMARLTGGINIPGLF